MSEQTWLVENVSRQQNRREQLAMLVDMRLLENANRTQQS